MKHIRQGDGRETGKSTQYNFFGRRRGQGALGEAFGKIQLGFTNN
jgi:hypothetical protein